MRLSWRREVRTVEYRPMADHKVMELQIAKEILAEIFHARPADVEQMIHCRLEERSRRPEYQEGLWPATFCLVD